VSIDNLTFRGSLNLLYRHVIDARRLIAIPR